MFVRHLNMLVSYTAHSYPVRQRDRHDDRQQTETITTLPRRSNKYKGSKIGNECNQ